MLIDVEIDAEALDEFDAYCINICKNRDAVMNSIIADYIKEFSNEDEF